MAFGEALRALGWIEGGNYRLGFSSCIEQRAFEAVDAHVPYAKRRRLWERTRRKAPVKQLKPPHPIRGAHVKWNGEALEAALALDSA